jgi:hypothetical protein
MGVYILPRQRAPGLVEFHTPTKPSATILNDNDDDSSRAGQFYEMDPAYADMLRRGYQVDPVMSRIWRVVFFLHFALYATLRRQRTRIECRGRSIQFVLGRGVR